MSTKIKVTCIALVLIGVGFLSISASSGSKISWGDPYGKGRTNLVEKYYQELTDKIPELKNLETELKEIHSRENILVQNFNDYHNDSKTYYSDAIDMSHSISDTLLKNRMIELLAKSTENYNTSTKPILTNITHFKQNNIKISDYYAALKIVRTLSVIEKYQKENLPSNAAFENHTKNQTNVLDKIKGLTPAY
jgi:hypothetical protein